MLSVTFLTASGILFEGEATRVILPGEQGTFEIGLFHKTLVSRLLSGSAIVDDRVFPIKHGVVKVKNDQVIAMLEPDEA